MKKLEFIEIAPRDGFQSVKEFIDTDIKKEVVDRLVDVGFKNIQVTSFISEKAIPQMRDAKEVAEYAINKYKDVNFFALAPNFMGVENAYNAGLREITYVISLSKTHNMSNVKRTHDESFAELEKVIKTYPDMKINLDVATAFGCPFEGRSKIEDLVKFIERGVSVGVTTFDICDTIGVAYPKQVETFMTVLQETFPTCKFGIHIHDTRSMGIICTLTAIKAGITRIFSVCSGLGGCPFAPGASGNTASEDLANMLILEGYEIDVDLEKLIETAKFIYEKIPTGIFSSHHIHIKNSICSCQ